MTKRARRRWRRLTVVLSLGRVNMSAHALMCSMDFIIEFESLKGASAFVGHVNMARAKDCLRSRPVPQKKINHAISEADTGSAGLVTQ